MDAPLTSEQQALVDSPTAKFFLRGRAGAGKTTVGVRRALRLLTSSLPAESILILTPQRSLQAPYEDAILQSGYSGGQVTFATVGGLARRMCDLFWPLAAERAGFKSPDQPPVFLTLETAQYYMAHLVRPKLDEGYFASVTIDRNRLYSQIIDNLNKAALIGFDHREIAERLAASENGDPEQHRIHADAQACANLFREYCLEHNLLDYSLQFEIFTNILWDDPLVRDYLTQTHRHLIYDNVEEDPPRAHDILREWIPNLDSALLIFDEGGGFRRFLSADPVTGEALGQICEEEARLDNSFVMSEEVARLETQLTEAINPALTPFPSPEVRERGAEGGVRAYDFLLTRFYPELLDEIAKEIQRLVSEENISPEEIVILAPYLSDSLRFSLMHRLEQAEIPVRSHRPSRSLRDEPASHALLTLASLAHPGWHIHPARFDVAYAFLFSLGTDLVRAQLLSEIVYRQKDMRLSPFEEIQPDMQERVTYALGERYASLRQWLELYRESEPLPLDHFLRKIFGEILSQPGFGFHQNLDAVRVAASLIESVEKFRNSIEQTFDNSIFDHRNSNIESSNIAALGKEYLTMLQDGVIAASYLEAWNPQQDNAVLVAPAHSFLMMNRPATIQFWLDVGSSGWHDRLAQPLTHPYVLSREWNPSREWTDADEVQSAKEALARLVSGLLYRCRSRVYLGLSELGESGFEQRGDLLRAWQKVSNPEIT
ncbi:MAG: hypothetical protein HFACDABA_00203 [Anaerolineales bacterium]|nr:hypothetical protein [Anaerolineales bacterium]